MNPIRKFREAAGMPQHKLASLADTSQVQIHRLESGERELTKAWAERLAGPLGVSAAQLLFPEHHAPYESRKAEPYKSDHSADPNARIIGSPGNYVRVPIRGRAMGGEEGVLIVDNEIFGYVDAPERVAGVPDAYAVYVVGDSMLERFKRGEIVYVDPHRPPVAGDDVVIQISEDDGVTVKGFIKRLVSRDGKTLKVRQLNPAEFLSFPEKNVVGVHLIVLAGRA